MNRRDFLKTTLALGGAAVLPLSMSEEAQGAVTCTPKEIFTTGLPNLDRLMNGGVRPGELAIVIGEATGGKTAFCRSMMHANGGKPNTISHNYSEKGNDLLLLNPTGHSLLIPNYETPLKEGEYAWQRMDLTARAMKRYAMESNEAVIWTVPVVHSRFDVPVDSFAFIRCADYCLSIQRRRRRIYLAKNRHGHRGVVPIRIAHNGKDYVMRQAGEHFLTFGA